jgi:hypothetical protein
MAFETRIENTKRLTAVVSDRAFFAGSVALLALVVLALLGITSLFMDPACGTGDTGRFFAMAKVIVSGATPYLDYQDPKPPLVFFTLTVPALLGQRYIGGLLLVGVCDLASAVLVLLIARSFYGRSAGLLAGLLFLGNMAWAQGFFVITEPFTVLFLLLATYFALCSPRRGYFIAGLAAGVAIGFKQYALIAVPLLLLAMYLRGDLRKAPALLAGITLPLAIIFGAIGLAYGWQALDAALYWSFGVAGSYVRRIDVNNALYSGTSLTEICLNLGLAAVIAGSLIAGLAKSGGYWNLRPETKFFLLAAVGFALTLLVRPYLHYWALAAPFLAILWAGWLIGSEG